MSNLEILKNSFKEVIGIDLAKIDDLLEYGSYGWDSVAHMKLIAEIETQFDIMLETEDVIDMSSFKKAKEIVQKYEIIIES